MNRRTFLSAVTGGLLAAPLAAEAQQAAKVPRIGYLANRLAANPDQQEAFLQGVRDLGYVDGRNVVIEYRDAEGKLERLPALAAQLVALKVDVIVAAAGTLPALAAISGRLVSGVSRATAPRPADGAGAGRGAGGRFTTDDCATRESRRSWRPRSRSHSRTGHERF